ncbi:TetR family transcriptional regulator [Pseudonocardia sp. GCM10023141]|uniref:TetR/AcrR family transcriptional regulator n=1 Tax=Pseudonocardia sp. GCM10023141 TaxID=3252653 RepID=UPI00360D8ECD
MVFTERSRASRDAVLAAARHAFAEHGYERTTVRGVASAAGLDPSMVMRYYGSKEGLFAAAVDVDLRLPDLSAIPRPQRGAALAEHFLTLWEDPPTAEVLALLLRSAATNPAAADRIRDVFTGQVVALAHTLDPADETAARRRAAQLTAHMLGTALCRYVLRLPPVATPSREAAAAAMAPVVQAILDA